jgi:hypothetical protein
MRDKNKDDASPFVMLADSPYGFDPGDFLGAFKQSIPDATLLAFIKQARTILQFNKSVTAEDLILPLQRQRWPPSRVRELNAAANDLIFGHRTAADQGERLLYAYLGALNVYCLGKEPDQSDDMLGVAVGAILTGTEGAPFRVQCEVFRFFVDAVVRAEGVRVRSTDLPVLYFATVVAGARLLAGVCGTAVSALGRSEFPSSGKLDFLGEFERVTGDILRKVGNDVLGPTGQLQVNITTLLQASKDA